MEKPRQLFPAATTPPRSPTNPTPSQAQSPRPLFAETPKAAPPIDGKPVVVALPGMFVRKRPDVTVGVLRTFNLDVADEAVFQAALEEILHADPESLTMELALEFGVADQKEFALASQKMLDLSMDPVLADVLAKCKSIAADVRKTESGGGFSRFLDSLVEAESDKDRLDRVNKTAISARDQIDQVPALRAKAAILQKDMDAILARLQKRLVVGKWFVAVMTKKEIVAILDGRLQSISVTRLSLLQARQQTKVVDDRMIHLTTVVNNTLVTLIPAWHGRGVAANERKHSTPSPNDLKSRILEALDAVK